MYFKKSNDLYSTTCENIPNGLLLAFFFFELLSEKIITSANSSKFIILGGFLLVFTVIAIFSLSTEYALHEMFHGIILMLSLYMSFLSFRAFYKYKITRMLFTAVAFAVFGVSEVIEMAEALEDPDDVFSLDEIRDYVIFAAISIFAIGTFYKSKFDSK